MKIMQGLFKVALSPLRGVVEVFDDISGNNGESQQGLSILTVGTTSVVKGTVKGVRSGVDDIFEN